MKYILIIILGYPRPGPLALESPPVFNTLKACKAAVKVLRDTREERKMGDVFGYCLEQGADQ